MLRQATASRSPGMEASHSLATGGSRNLGMGDSRNPGAEGNRSLGMGLPRVCARSADSRLPTGSFASSTGTFLIPFETTFGKFR